MVTDPLNDPFSPDNLVGQNTQPNASVPEGLQDLDLGNEQADVDQQVEQAKAQIKSDFPELQNTVGGQSTPEGTIGGQSLAQENQSDLNQVDNVKQTGQQQQAGQQQGGSGLQAGANAPGLGPEDRPSQEGGQQGITVTDPETGEVIGQFATPEQAREAMLERNRKQGQQDDGPNEKLTANASDITNQDTVPEDDGNFVDVNGKTFRKPAGGKDALKKAMSVADGKVIVTEQGSIKNERGQIFGGGKFVDVVGPDKQAGTADDNTLDQDEIGQFQEQTSTGGFGPELQTSTRPPELNNQTVEPVTGTTAGVTGQEEQEVGSLAQQALQQLAGGLSPQERQTIRENVKASFAPELRQQRKLNRERKNNFQAGRAQAGDVGFGQSRQARQGETDISQLNRDKISEIKGKIREEVQARVMSKREQDRKTARIILKNLRKQREQRRKDRQLQLDRLSTQSKILNRRRNNQLDRQRLGFRQQKFRTREGRRRSENAIDRVTKLDSDALTRLQQEEGETLSALEQRAGLPGGFFENLTQKKAEIEKEENVKDQSEFFNEVVKFSKNKLPVGQTATFNNPVTGEQVQVQGGDQEISIREGESGQIFRVNKTTGRVQTLRGATAAGAGGGTGAGSGIAGLGGGQQQVSTAADSLASEIINRAPRNDKGALLLDNRFTKHLNDELQTLEGDELQNSVRFAVRNKIAKKRQVSNKIRQFQQEFSNLGQDTIRKAVKQTKNPRQKLQQLSQQTQQQQQGGGVGLDEGADRLANQVQDAALTHGRNLPFLGAASNIAGGAQAAQKVRQNEEQIQQGFQEAQTFGQEFLNELSGGLIPGSN